MNAEKHVHLINAGNDDACKNRCGTKKYIDTGVNRIAESCRGGSDKGEPEGQSDHQRDDR